MLKLRSKMAAAFAGFAIGGAAPSLAQDYPVDTVKLVTHSSAGSGTDIYLRELSRYLGKYLGPNLVVENITGGSGANAMATLAQSEPDGSIFYGTTPTYINTSLISELQYTWEDLEGLVNVFLDPQVVYVRAESPYKSLTQVVEASKESPGAVLFGVSTPGSLDRQVMEQFKQISGAQGAVVPHEGGGELLISVLNGTVDIGIGEIGEMSSQLEAEQVRIIATYTEERLDRFPDVPTAREQGIDLVVNKFRGLAGPKGLPDDIIAAWEDAIKQVLEDEEFKQWYTEQSLVPNFIPHDEYNTFLADFAVEQEEFLRTYGIIE